MKAPFLDDTALADLLVQLETEGLSMEGDRELDERLGQYPDASREALASAASAAVLAARLPGESLPAALRARLIEQGEAELRARSAQGVVPLTPRPKAGRTASLGWYAAAASLLLAVTAWWPQLAGEGPPPPLAAKAVPSLAEQRAALAASGVVVQQAWTATDDAAATGLSGDVVWDPRTQTGYMRFTGLASNDASAAQYQLWIFDATRDDRYPVDGGVFDVPAGTTEVVVPIQAALPVRQAALFAVTVERPGGVVVSSRERIVALAQVATG